MLSKMAAIDEKKKAEKKTTNGNIKSNLQQSKEDSFSSADEAETETKKRRKSNSKKQGEKRSKKEDLEKIRLANLIDQSKFALKQKQETFSKRNSSLEQSEKLKTNSEDLQLTTDVSKNEVKKKKPESLGESVTQPISSGEPSGVRRTSSTSSSSR